MPAFGYGLAFLGMIPCYALIYFFLIPNDFYHTSVTREQPYFAAVVALRDQLQTVLADDLRAAYGGNVIAVGDDEALCIDRLQIAGFSIDDLGPASFKIIAPLSEAAVVGEECPSDSITSVEVLDAGIDLGPGLDVFQEPEVAGAASPAWLTIRFLTSESHAAARRLFPRPTNGSIVQVSGDGVHYQFAMPPAVSRQLQTVLRASQGFPSGTQGEFSRMVYLSAITATTTATATSSRSRCGRAS